MTPARIALVGLLPSVALATPVTLAHQARLLDSTGSALEGTVELEFTLHADGSTPATVFTERITTTANQGYVSVVLGAHPLTTPLDDALFNGDPRYLQVAIVHNGTAAPLGPRQLLATVPAAVHATNVSGGTIQVGQDDSACESGEQGQLRWDDGLEVCDGEGHWIAIASKRFRSCEEIHQDDTSSPSGVYTVDPDNSGELQVYCDMRPSGGWTLLMRIRENSSTHAESNAASGAYPCPPDGAACRLSTADISRFNRIAGRQVYEIRPDNTTYIPWYVASGSDDEVWPSNLECTNRSNLLGSSSTAWIVTSYPDLASAVNGTSGDVGDYSSAEHYYPTPYFPQQFFFQGSEGAGLRASTSWNGGHLGNLAGTVWVR